MNFVEIEIKKLLSVEGKADSALNAGSATYGRCTVNAQVQRRLQKGIIGILLYIRDYISQRSFCNEQAVSTIFENGSVAQHLFHFRFWQRLLETLSSADAGRNTGTGLCSSILWFANPFQITETIFYTY